MWQEFERISRKRDRSVRGSAGCGVDCEGVSRMCGRSVRLLAGIGQGVKWSSGRGAGM